MEKFDKEDLINIVAIFLDKQGIKPYEVEVKEDEEDELLPDMLGVTKKEVEVQIAIQVETCESINTEDSKNKIKAIADHVKKTGEGYMLFVPTECEEEAENIVKDLKIEDIVDIIPLSFKS